MKRIPQYRFTRTRLAPTPSGYLHWGNLYSFVLTTALARRSGARILLRIDDLDQGRFRMEYLEDLFDTLNYLDLPWDEGPRNVKEVQLTHSRIHRLSIYESYLLRLSEAGLVYACRCSHQKRARDAEEGTADPCRNMDIFLDEPDCIWRLRQEEAPCIVMKDVCKGQQRWTLPSDVRNPLIRRKDGMPFFHLASLVDDLEYGVDLIVRGEDLRSSSLAQLLLARRLGEPAFESCSFVHHSLLMYDQHRKLSKSSRDDSIFKMRAQGASPRAIYRKLAQWLELPGLPDSWPLLAEALLEQLERN